MNQVNDLDRSRLEDMKEKLRDGTKTLHEMGEDIYTPQKIELSEEK